MSALAFCSMVQPSPRTPSPIFMRRWACRTRSMEHFDLLSLHAFLLIHGLTGEHAGPRLAQAVFDAMFSDMDINLREMGVGDLGVGRRVRAMWEAPWPGQHLHHGDEPAWRRHWSAISGGVPPRRKARPLRSTRYVLAQTAWLADGR